MHLQSVVCRLLPENAFAMRKWYHGHFPECCIGPVLSGVIVSGGGIETQRLEVTSRRSSTDGALNSLTVGKSVVIRVFYSTTLAIRASLIPVLDFFFQTSIFFHAVSLRCFGLVPPISLDGGVVGGVIGSLPEFDALRESSVKLASPLPLELWPLALGILLGFTVRLEFDEGGGLGRW
jgi:hypothetical protein